MKTINLKRVTETFSEKELKNVVARMKHFFSLLFFIFMGTNVIGNTITFVPVDTTVLVNDLPNLAFKLGYVDKLGCAQLTSHVDECFELTSLVFRLAAAKEYVNNELTDYVKEVDAYFSPYKDHPLIQFVKEIRARDGVAYTAVAGSTNLLKIKNNKIEINPQVDINKYLNGERRWTKESFNKYVNLLNVFYKDTKFKTFYNQHQDLYIETEKRFNELLATIHTDWFLSFFGKPLDESAISIYISLLNGKSNYSMDQGIIIGCSKKDKNGIPTFIVGYDADNNPIYNETVLLTTVHEFSHLYTNPLTDQYQSKMIDSFEKMFPCVKEQLKRAAYEDPNTFLNEGFNRLFVNMYAKEFLPNYEKPNVSVDHGKGFIWMRRAVSFMDNFMDNREIYPHIEDFMPQLISFVNMSGDQIEQIMDEYKHEDPYVVNVYPVLNSTISSNTHEIKVEFSHPMFDTFGILKTSDENLAMPVMNGKVYWSENKKVLSIPVKLDKGKSYGFILPAGVYQSDEISPMAENYKITFKTTEQ
jgi:hypothetical protein